VQLPLPWRPGTAIRLLARARKGKEHVHQVRSEVFVLGSEHYAWHTTKYAFTRRDEKRFQVWEQRAGLQVAIVATHGVGGAQMSPKWLFQEQRYNIYLKMICSSRNLRML
jgi:hypothetical protein